MTIILFETRSILRETSRIVGISLSTVFVRLHRLQRNLITACPYICYLFCKIWIADMGISVLIITTFIFKCKYPIFYQFIFPITIRIFHLPYSSLIDIVIGIIISSASRLVYHFVFTLSNASSQHLYAIMIIHFLIFTYLFVCYYLLFFHVNLFIGNHF